MSTTQQKITDLQDKITAAESDARTSTEDDRARLEQLRELAAKEAAEENQRRAARRIAWARHYLETTHTEQAAEARKNATAARREFETILAEQPWVKALLGWQEAINEEHAVVRRGVHARGLLGMPATEPPAVKNVLPMRDSEVPFTPLGRVLHYLAESVDQPDPAAEVERLAASVEGKSDPLAEAVAATGVDKSDPLAYLMRDGSRLDVVQHPGEDGSTVTMHRNPNTNEWVLTDAAGQVKSTSWQQAKAQGRPTNPIDGRKFGSVLDEGTKKFVKTRIN